MSTRDEQLRERLDDDGLLREGMQFLPLASEASMLVFGQRTDARIELDALRAHATRYFQTNLGLTTHKRYDRRIPTRDVADVIVALASGASSVRRVQLRPTERADLDRAEAAERASRMGGMAALASRCATVWEIESESEGDEHALTLAAVLASVLLGPIVSGRGIFGVRGARVRLNELGRDAARA